MRPIRPVHGVAFPQGKRLCKAWMPLTVLLAVVAMGGRSLCAEDTAQPSDDAAVAQHVLSQLVYRHRRQQVLRDRALQELEAGNTLDGLAYLQRLLDYPEDGFVWPSVSQDPAADPVSRRPVSVRKDALRILGSLNSADLRTYERLYGPEADRLLAKARESGDPAAFQEVARRYYHTAAGFEAVDWLATRWLDRGLFGLAARSWWGLLSQPSHQKRITPVVLLKAALAHRLDHQPRREAALLDRLGNRRVSVAGGSEDSPRSLLANWTLPAHSAQRDRPSRPTPSRWPTPFSGDGRRIQTVAASAPYLNPLWTVRFSAQDNELIDGLFADWRQQQREQLQPLAVANSAVIVNGQVIVRDFEGLRSVALQTGRTLWIYPCETSLARTVRDIQDVLGPSVGAAQIRSFLDLQQAYVGNGTLLTPASDGERVYAVDEMDLTRWRSQSRRPPRLAENHDSDDIADRRTNRLIAFDVGPSPEWGTPRVPGTPFPGGVGSRRNGASVEKKPVWIAGGPEDAGTPLAGHFFLGPPLPVDHRLFALTESGRQLNLVALEPETGHRLWSQGLGYVDRPIEIDPQRAVLPCSPTYADGVLVCPTQLGILVGVDAIDGSLLWVYYYGDETMSRRLGGSSRRSRTLYGDTGFATLPHVQDGRIVYLPPQSDEIHCIDLLTGESVWRTPRQDGEYIGAVSEDRVLIVGRRFCRGLSLKDGGETWSVRMGLPSGRGLSLGTSYLVPLEDGRVATLDLTTGQEVGFTLGPVTAQDRFARPDRTEGRDWRPRPSQGTDRTAVRLVQGVPPRDFRWRPGNLLACGDVVLSVEPQQISVFPQAGALLAGLQQRLSGEAATPADQVLAGELELQLGRFDAAKSHLTVALNSSLDEPRRDRAETLMRELLYLELDAGRGDELAILQRLARLSRTPITRGRYLIESAELQMRRGDLDGLLDSAQEFAQLDLHEPLPMIGEPSHLISAASWVPGILGRVRNQFGEADLKRVHDRIDALQHEVLASGDVTGLQQFLAVYSRWPQAEAVRTRLADDYCHQGAFQKAELLLLKNRRSPDRHTAAEASRKLLELWDRLGLPEEAAGLLGDLDNRFPDVQLDSGLTAHEYVMQFPADGLTGMAYQRRTLPVAVRSGDRPIARVAISERRWFRNDPLASEIFREFPRSRATPDDNTFLLLYQGGSFDDGASVIVDRFAGRIVGKMDVPSRSYYPPPSRGAQVGHFIPVGSPASMNGISLLRRDDDAPAVDGNPRMERSETPVAQTSAADGPPRLLTGAPPPLPRMWTTHPKRIGDRQEVMLVGPAGPSFCTFQDREHLVVVDPADGRILWQRSDLDPHCGLSTDRYSGLFGDEDVLVLFNSDRSSYTVYRTATGDEVRHGRLDVDLRQRPLVFGRRFFYVAGQELNDGTGHDRRARIWDPLTDRLLFDEPALGRIRSTVMDDGNLVVALPPHRLMIVDMETGSVRLDLELPTEDVSQASYLRAFGDADRWYVNFWQNVNTSLDRYYTANTLLPNESIQGDVYALDKYTGRLLWKRTLAQRSAIRTPHYRLPFVITVSRLRGRVPSRSAGDGQTQGSLRVEVIDGQTGRTLGCRDNLFPDRIVQLSYQPEKGLIELHGEESVIELDFSPARQRLPSDDQPL